MKSLTFRHLQYLGLGGSGISDRSAPEHLGTAGDEGDQMGDVAAGATLGGGEGHALFLQQIEHLAFDAFLFLFHDGCVLFRDGRDFCAKISRIPKKINVNYLIYIKKP